MTKRARTHMLWENAPGGPRLVADAETIDLGAATSDGKPPKFRHVFGKERQRWIERAERAAGGGEAIFDLLVNDMPAEVDDVGAVRPLLFQAKHFVIDDSGVGFLADLATASDLLDDLREFALPPHDRMAITYHHPPRPGRGLIHTADGFEALTLWDHGRWKLFVRGKDGRLAVMPAWNTIAADGTVRNDELARRNDGTALWMLGTHADLLTAFFLVMAQPKHVVATFSEARRTLRRGRPVKFFARTQIKIDLSEPVQLRRAFQTGTHASPRWHEVRRHFVHRGGDRSCTHDWQPLESADGKKRWECACGRRRVERSYPNGRGDAGKGFVTQSYAVTAGRAG